VDYIVSLIDEDGDGKIDVNELILNYRIIVKELKNFDEQCELDQNGGERKGKKDSRNTRAKKNLFRRLESNIQYEKKSTQMKLKAEGIKKNTNLDNITRHATSQAREFVQVTKLINTNQNMVAEYKEAGNFFFGNKKK
jgi:hypothetical protein